MRKLTISILLIVFLFLGNINFVLAECQQPTVRSCNTECQHLPSYPTYEKEACITACIDDDQQNWANYYDCQDAEQEALQAQQAAEAQALAEQEALEYAELQKQQEEEAKALAEQEALEAQQQAELDSQQKALAEQEALKNTATEKNLASIGYIEGEVEIKQADGSWKQVSEDEKFSKGDVVRTRDGTAMITFFGSSDVTLGKNSEFVIGDVNSENTIFDLNFGRMWAWIEKLNKQKFSVRTPTAVHAVRGTEFVLEYDKNTETSSVYLYEGTLDIATETGLVELTAGNSLEINSETQEISILDEESWDLATQKLFLDESQLDFEEESSSSYNTIIIIALILILGFLVYRNKEKFKKILKKIKK